MKAHIKKNRFKERVIEYLLEIGEGKVFSPRCLKGWLWPADLRKARMFAPPSPLFTFSRSEAL
jgi:hypothetical protein